MIFGRLPGLWGMRLKPLSDELFLLLGEQLLDLMWPPLERLKQTQVLSHIQHCGSDIQIRKGRRLFFRPFALYPHREKLVQNKACTVQRRFRIMEQLVLGLGQRRRFSSAKEEVLFPHAGGIVAASRIKVKQLPQDNRFSQQIPLSLNPIESSCLSCEYHSLDKQSIPLLASKFFNL